MKTNNSSDYRLPAPIYTPGTDLLILSGTLRKPARKEEAYCVIELFTLANVRFRSVSVSFLFLKTDGSPAGVPTERTYSCGDLPRDSSFAGKEEFTVPYADADSFDAAVSRITFSDGTEKHFSPKEAIPLTHRRTLEEAFGDAVLADQFRIRYGEDCRMERTEEAGLWFCVCGAFNFSDETKCHQCSRPKRVLYDINPDALRVEAGTRLKVESAVSKEERALTVVKKKRRLRWLILLIPVLFLSVLLAATIPGALDRERRYSEAVGLLEDGLLDQAAALFEELPSYRDSDSLLHEEIPYIQAGRLVEDAESEDAADRLETIGKGSSDLSEDVNAAMLFYEAAAKAYDDLGNYKDSAAIASQCREHVEEEALSLKQGRYDAAKKALKDGKYSAAAAAFSRLSAFSDSENLIQECRYQKALSLFHFLSAYDVSRIYALITMDPGAVTVFSMPKDEALRLGSGCITELQNACGQDAVDVRLEDKPSADLLPFKDALSDFFLSLDAYKDSGDYPDRIAEETDYLRPFYMLCSTGDLPGAAEWLLSYQGVFPDREEWLELLKLYLPYCQNWDLFLGDASLLPYTIDQDFQCTSLSSRVILTRDIAVIRLSFGTGNAFTFDLAAIAGDVIFLNRELISGNYVATINHVGHLIFTRYDGDFNYMSSCEYEPA